MFLFTLHHLLHLITLFFSHQNTLITVSNNTWVHTTILIKYINQSTEIPYRSKVLLAMKIDAVLSCY